MRGGGRNPYIGPHECEFSLFCLIFNVIVSVFLFNVRIANAHINTWIFEYWRAHSHMNIANRTTRPHYTSAHACKTSVRTVFSAVAVNRSAFLFVFVVVRDIVCNRAAVHLCLAAARFPTVAKMLLCGIVNTLCMVLCALRCCMRAVCLSIYMKCEPYAVRKIFITI